MRGASFRILFLIISASELVVRTCKQSAEKRGKACRQELHLCRFFNFLCERFFCCCFQTFSFFPLVLFPCLCPTRLGWLYRGLSVFGPCVCPHAFFVGFTLCCENFSDIFLCAFEHILLLASLEIFVCSSFARNLPKGKKIIRGNE